MTRKLHISKSEGYEANCGRWTNEITDLPMLDAKHVDPDDDPGVCKTCAKIERKKGAATGE